MTRPQARAIVPMEVFVEQDEIAPVWILLEFPRAAVDGTPAVGATQEDAGEAAREFFRHLVERHLVSRARGALDGEFIAVVTVVRQKRPDDQPVDGHPD